jgi:hypothetical protein
MSKLRNSMLIFAFILLLGVTFSQQTFWDEIEDNYQNFVNEDTRNATDIIDTNLFSRQIRQLARVRITWVYDSMRATTIRLQQQYSCYQLQTDHVVAILYYSHRPFFSSIDSVLDLDGLLAPSVGLYNQACRILQECVQGDTAYDIADQSSCQDRVVDTYRQYYDATENANSLTYRLEREHIYFNGNLEDSPYDIISDIDRIGQLLFVSHIPSPELVYFSPLDARTVNSTSIDGNDYSNFLLGGAWLLNPLTGQAWNTWVEWSDETIFTTGFIVDSVPISITRLQPYFSGRWPVVDSGIAGDIDTFISRTNRWQNINWNDISNDVLPDLLCLAPDSLGQINSEFSFDDTMGETGLIRSYESGLQLYLSAMQSDLFFSRLVTVTGSVFVAGSVNSLTGSIVQQDPSITNLLDQIASGITQDEVDMIWACVDNCTVLATVDQLACIAQCYCKQVASQAIQVDGYEVLREGSFSIRFCTIAPRAVTIRRGGVVLSVEDIVQEIQAVLASLKRSGQLYKNVRTEEFLDLGLKKNSFSDVFSFSINVRTMPRYSSLSSVASNSLLNSSYDSISSLIAWYQDESLIVQRNKYLVIASPAFSVASNSYTVSSPSSLYTTIQQETWYTQFEINLPKMIQDHVVATEINRKTAATLSSLYDFLEANLYFLDSMYDSLQDMNVSAKALREKIEQAK